MGSGSKFAVEGLHEVEKSFEGDAFYRVVAGPVPPGFVIPDELKDLATDVQRPRQENDPAARTAECPVCLGLKSVPTKFGARSCDFCGGVGSAPGLVKLLISEAIPRPGEMAAMLAQGKEIFPITNRFAKALYTGEKLPFPIYHCLLVRPESQGTQYKGSALIWMRPDGANLQRHNDPTLGDVMIAYHAIASRVERVQGKFHATMEYSAPMEGSVLTESIGSLDGELVENPDTGKKEWQWSWILTADPKFVKTFDIRLDIVVERTIELGLRLTGWEPKS